MSIETKKKFGVTFNPKMSVKTMTNLWFDEVEPEIRLLYPDLNKVMEDNRKKVIVFGVKQKVKEIKVDIENTTIAAVNAAAAIAAGIVSLPADIAARIAALADIDLSIDIAASGKTQINREIDKIIPEYLPDEENI